jgi:TRAF3-interacting protein 1
VPDLKVAAVSGIMKDGDNADSDDEADAGGDNHSSASGSRPSSSSSAQNVDDGAQHGRLVREILKNEAAARKEREDEETKEAAGGPTLESETGIRLGRRKKSFKDKSNTPASSAAEMNELRSNIQRICQATLPMGKAIEFVHEDLDAMSKELDKWKKEYEKKCDVYEEEKKKTDEALQPLQVQLLEVEELIKEQVHKINTLKGTIAKNEEKTQKLLRMVVSA